MKIGILETGKVNPKLVAEHGHYVPMFEAFLQRANPGFTVKGWDIVDAGHFPTSPHDADGWLVTGSKFGVYEALPWMEPLKAFLRGTYAAKVPIVGICFGHQILADALGGKVVKSEKGWGCGVHAYHMTAAEEWMAGNVPQNIRVHAMHQDQVVEKPADARVIAASEFCPHAGLAYGAHALSFQPHPEFNAAYQADLIHLRRGGEDGIPDPVAGEALCSLEGGVDNDTLARWVTEFFQRGAA